MRDNMVDAAMKGRTSRGANHHWQTNPEGRLYGELGPRAKLTNEQVLEIRHRKASGERTTVLAAEFNTTQVNIDRIVRRATWKHI